MMERDMLVEVEEAGEVEEEAMEEEEVKGEEEVEVEVMEEEEAMEEEGKACYRLQFVIVFGNVRKSRDSSNIYFLYFAEEADGVAEADGVVEEPPRQEGVEVIISGDIRK